MNVGSEGQMCSTCCALGVGGGYREHRVLVATGVVSRPCRGLGREDNRVNLRKNEFGVFGVD